MKSATLDGAEWMAVLERLAAALPSEGPPLRLCLIGSAACLFGGMEGRTSRDLDIAFRQQCWAELAALVRFAQRDVPVTLAQTDPALYRQLREQVTRFFLLGGDAFSLPALESKLNETR